MKKIEIKSYPKIDETILKEREEMFKHKNDGVMEIGEFIDKIIKAENLLFEKHIQANSIIINENYLDVPEAYFKVCDTVKVLPQMICGLEVNYVKLDLAVPFAVYRADETKSEKEIKKIRREVLEELKSKVEHYVWEKNIPECMFNQIVEELENE